MSRIAAFVAFLLACGCTPQQQPKPEGAGTLVAIAREITLSSAILGEDRTILIGLPEDYEAASARYPVLYLLDGGQNIMHVAGSIEVLSRTGRIPKMIVVGIPSTNRERDLTPSRMDGFAESGGGPRFLDFLAEELIPEIEERYRTHPFRVLEGHSLGGALATYALLNRTEMFDAFVVISPSMWWNGEELTQQAQTELDPSAVAGKTAYFGIGREDGWGMRQELKRFVAVLEAIGTDGLRWEHREFEDEGHMSAPLLANYFGLRMIFDDLQLPSAIRESFTSRAFLDHESRITARYGAAAAQTAESYVSLAFGLLEQERFAEAVTVLKRNAEVYHEYPPSFRWLAEAQEKSGDSTGALSSYRVALSLSETVKVGEEDLYRDNVRRLETVLAGEN